MADITLRWRQPSGQRSPLTDWSKALLALNHDLKNPDSAINKGVFCFTLHVGDKDITPRYRPIYEDTHPEFKEYLFYYELINI